MDFSSNAFRTPASSSQSLDDTMSHANMVMACRWGWTSSPGPNADAQTAAASSVSQHATISSFSNVRSKRFAPCQGRLYHQLLCSHRIRTDLVEDCGANCIEPCGKEIGLVFICNECIQGEAAKIWADRQAQHNATWPSMDQMSPEQYHQWYAEHRQLEDEYARDRKMYEIDLKTKTRPSNICSALEASKDEREFATELDTLSLSLSATNDDAAPHTQLYPDTRTRLSLPTDASEQLHWNLNTLALDRGSCGVEYASSPTSNHIPAIRQMDHDELWRKPRERD